MCTKIERADSTVAVKRRHLTHADDRTLRRRSRNCALHRAFLCVVDERRNADRDENETSTSVDVNAHPYPHHPMPAPPACPHQCGALNVTDLGADAAIRSSFLAFPQ